MRIVSGGQAGVDRAALDVALELGIPCGGWCPAGRLAEDGVIPPRYPLRETPSVDTAQRTRWNVRDSDATLILATGPLTGGSELTARVAREIERPLLVLDPTTPGREALLAWLQPLLRPVLNVAGPRESTRPGIYALAHAFFLAALAPVPS